MKTTAKEEIIKRLQESPIPLAVHQFNLTGYNENNLATRASELAREGRIIGSRIPGKAYKVWSLAQ